MEREKLEGTAYWLHANHLHRIYVCPECPFVLSEASILGSHLERHCDVQSPVVGSKGLIKSKSCPKGCGRYFAPGRGIGEHLITCDGQSPLNGKEKEDPKDFDAIPVVDLAERAIRGEIKSSHTREIKQ